MELFPQHPHVTDPRTLAGYLDAHHYLGATQRGWAWHDDDGVIVLAKPTSRYLPADGTWLELSRWCIRPDRPNAGTRQWAAVRAYIATDHPEVTTVVSYSDPAAGHTGALYRACGWLWAPTWHRLRPPPTGGGSWRVGVIQAPKDRWVDPIRPDDRRPELLALGDDAVAKIHPGYVEPARLRRLPYAARKTS